jgi:hypothetical protein
VFAGTFAEGSLTLTSVVERDDSEMFVGDRPFSAAIALIDSGPLETKVID